MVLAEYFSSSNVHVTICRDESYLQKRLHNYSKMEHFYCRCRDISWLFWACGLFTKEEFSLWSHNCKHFVKHVISYLS